MMASTASAAALSQEIAATERALEETEQQSNRNGKEEEPVWTRLQRLEAESTELKLVQQAAAYSKEFNNSNSSTSSHNDLQRLDALSTVLKENDPPPFSTQSPSLYQQLYQDEFLPLRDYVRADRILNLRRTLQHSKYPATDGCEELLRQCEANEMDGAYATIVSCCQDLDELTRLDRAVVAHVEGTTAVPNNTLHPAVVELCRPLAERIQYHFVSSNNDDKDKSGGGGGSSNSGKSPTNTRIDRLPEWLLQYLRQHVFGTGGSAWELVYYGLQSEQLAMDFLNEILRMVQWVLGERNFFRHPSVAGPSSQPLLLCRAVEQFLQFDEFIQGLLVDENDNSTNKNRILSLVDVCIAGDEELLQWWLQRERESVFSTLLDDDSSTMASPGRVWPKAELFCALIRSVQTKSSVFSFSGPYLSQVAAPLCGRFLDGVQASAVELKALLTQRQLPLDSSLEANVVCWMELINGTRMAATMLIAEDGTAASAASDDLARFGRSLERLHGVLLDEFVTNVVEILLMERAKFAAYLMRCSHMLSSGPEEVEWVKKLTDISPDLQETHRILELILNVCDANGGISSMEESSDDVFGDPSRYAAFMMQERVLSLVAEKLLECALDIHGMTPDLLHPGCSLFARDVHTLFGDRLLPNHALRVLDITKLMSLESPALVGIGGALCGLSGRPAPLTEDIFEADERLFEEAISMVRAKGFVFIELPDVFAVLNRRRDL